MNEKTDFMDLLCHSPYTKTPPAPMKDYLYIAFTGDSFQFPPIETYVLLYLGEEANMFLIP